MMLDHVDGGLIARELQLIVQCQVGVHRYVEIDYSTRIIASIDLFF